MRIITFCLAVLCTALLTTPGLHAQDLRPATLIENARAEKSFEERFDLFSFAKSAAPVAVLDAAGAPYDLLDLNPTALSELREAAPEKLELTLPGATGNVSLVRTNIFADGFRVTESGTNTYHKTALGLHYRGIVTDDPGSLVAISIFDGEVSGIIATNAGNFVLGKMAKGDQHILYNDKDLPSPDLGECATPDSGLPYSPKDLVDLDPGQKDVNNCVNVWMEADYSIYQQRGSGTASFITALFNQVAVLYANENINLVMSELFIWTSNDPYNSGSSTGNLNAFVTNRTSFNGDIAHLVSFQASGGVAYVDVLCSNSYGYGFSSIDNNFNNVPSYSWSVNVLAHELGHNFGSQHTHACVWNGNNTAIDGCYTTTGGCAAPAIPSGGGTIMSYCHLTSAGVNFNLGFGAQPGNLIRNRAYNSSCLTSCSTGGGGGGGGGSGGGSACTDNVTTITILTDNYPTETAWTLTNASGNVVATGGGYTSRNTTYTEEACLPDGCYVFNITDSYGDGICCSYGNGAYTINLNGTDIATGGNFGRSTKEEFCAQTSGGGGGGGDDDDGGDGGGDTTCDALSFSTNPPATYGGSQDRGTVAVMDANTIMIQNNAWKAVNLDYTVTPNTIIEFEFGSTIQGEIHGIGFDNNNGISSNFTFQLFGTQNWGIGAFDNYAQIGTWKGYTIPVGQYYTGNFNRLFFAADHDGGARNGNSFFRNIRIYEGSNCVALIPGTGEPIITTPEATIVDQGETVHVFPSPASDLINLNVSVPEATTASMRIIDVTGRTLRRLKQRLTEGQQQITLPVRDLPAGTYLLRLETTAGYNVTTRFAVAR